MSRVHVKRESPHPSHTGEPSSSSSDLRATRQPHHGRLVSVPASGTADVGAHLKVVDEFLAGVMADLADIWGQVNETNGPVDVLGDCDLPQLMTELINGGGKRLRPVMAYLGWLSGGGRARSVGHREVVSVSAALELLHLFVLVHDDVMDESDSRRGRPTVHVQAARLHTASAGLGNPRRFGESIAVLVGDLAHGEASNIVADLPAPMRRIWRILVAELVAGQRRDLVGGAAGRRDLEFARSVARMKSGRYTVERPLELGAAAAGASRIATDALGGYGRAVGEAFALRDDLLGVWGDPSRTGKPAGDDLISGKPTVILALAKQRLRSPGARAVLARVGSPAFCARDLTALRDELQDGGVVAAVEDMIADQVETALSALDDGALDPEGVAQLTGMAHRIAWREA